MICNKISISRYLLEIHTHNKTNICTCLCLLITNTVRHVCSSQSYYLLCELKSHFHVITEEEEEIVPHQEMDIRSRARQIQRWEVMRMTMREDRLVMLLMELAGEIALLLTTLGNVTAAPFSPPVKSQESAVFLSFLDSDLLRGQLGPQCPD